MFVGASYEKKCERVFHQESYVFVQVVYVHLCCLIYLAGQNILFSKNSIKDCLLHLFYGFRNKYFNKIL